MLLIEDADGKMLACVECGLGFAVFHDSMAGAPPTPVRCPACECEQPHRAIQDDTVVEECRSIIRNRPAIPEGYFKTITVCGSTKFKEEYEWVHKELTLKNWLVYSVGYYGHRDGDPRIPEKKEMLDAIHIMKIMQSDAIFVVNPGGYVGESTRNEMKAAAELGKRIYRWD